MENQGALHHEEEVNKVFNLAGKGKKRGKLLKYQKVLPEGKGCPPKKSGGESGITCFRIRMINKEGAEKAYNAFLFEDYCSVQRQEGGGEEGKKRLIQRIQRRRGRVLSIIGQEKKARYPEEKGRARTVFLKLRKGLSLLSARGGKVQGSFTNEAHWGKKLIGPD